MAVAQVVDPTAAAAVAVGVSAVARRIAGVRVGRRDCIGCVALGYMLMSGREVVVVDGIVRRRIGKILDEGLGVVGNRLRGRRRRVVVVGTCRFVDLVLR